MNIVFCKGRAKARQAWASLAGFVRDRQGTGGIEFAIIAPLLIVAYIGAFELSVGYNVSRKVARASSTVADIVTQQTDVSKDFLDGMADVAESIMAPYGTGYTMKITGITVTGAGVGVVAWSRDEDEGTPYTAGSPVTLSTDVTTANKFVVRTELVLDHELLLFAPGLTDSTLKTITLEKIYYYRQRIGDAISCTDCS